MKERYTIRYTRQCILIWWEIIFYRASLDNHKHFRYISLDLDWLSSIGRKVEMRRKKPQALWSPNNYNHLIRSPPHAIKKFCSNDLAFNKELLTLSESILCSVLILSYQCNYVVLWLFIILRLKNVLMRLVYRLQHSRFCRCLNPSLNEHNFPSVAFVISFRHLDCQF